MKSCKKSSTASSKDEKGDGTSEKSPPITRGRPASQRKKFKKSLGPDFLDPLELGPTYASKRGVHQVTDLKAGSSSAINVVSSNNSAPKKLTQLCSKCEIEFDVGHDLNGDSRSVDQQMCPLCDKMFRGVSDVSKRSRKVNNKSTSNAKSTTPSSSTLLRPVSAIATAASVTTVPAMTATPTVASEVETASETISTSASTLTSTSIPNSSSSSTSTSSPHLSDFPYRDHGSIFQSSPADDSSIMTDNTEVVISSKTAPQLSSESPPKAEASSDLQNEMDPRESSSLISTVEQKSITVEDIFESKDDGNDDGIGGDESEMQIDEAAAYNREEEREENDHLVPEGSQVLEARTTAEEAARDEEKSPEEENCQMQEENSQIEEESASESVEMTNESAQVTSEELVETETNSNGKLEISPASDLETNVESKIGMSNESTQVTVTNAEASAASLKSESSSAESTSSMSDEAKTHYRFRSPDTWSVDEVEQFITSTGFSRESQTFKEQEIDGKSLLLLKRDDVLTGLGFKLGPALKIYSFIHHLQNSNLLTVLPTPPGSVTAESTADAVYSNSASTNVNCVSNTVDSSSSTIAKDASVNGETRTVEINGSSQVNSDETSNQIDVSQVANVDTCESETVTDYGTSENLLQMPMTVEDNFTMETDPSSLPAASIEPLGSNV